MLVTRKTELSVALNKQQAKGDSIKGIARMTLVAYNVPWTTTLATHRGLCQVLGGSESIIPSYAIRIEKPVNSPFKTYKRLTWFLYPQPIELLPWPELCHRQFELLTFLPAQTWTIMSDVPHSIIPGLLQLFFADYLGISFLWSLILELKFVWWVKRTPIISTLGGNVPTGSQSLQIAFCLTYQWWKSP